MSHKNEAYFASESHSTKSRTQSSASIPADGIDSETYPKSNSKAEQPIIPLEDDLPKGKRLSVSFSSSDVKKLDWLTNSQQITQNEVLRKAIATEEYIQRVVQTGCTILVRKPDGSIAEVVFR
ncbi:MULTISPECIES: hypothetical protein [unclassified Tolypothrix]|uniref:hypothetical protein n=1 Tax=unclassified Tolypothrix TaxID=2649714 RepID=UPI0005EABFFC|nr:MULTISPECIES: hypothetical protein [unclassified Tolypothrix]BAY96050.1 hypothetical protein NIES3275_81270 [Microchaete diplosiphon NIES-3275]EKE98241.1 hypothetical protein FDUTEX481_04259 [Tolypothrix sp. PCC 7601]MBE9085512.1 hypothetical protein [Tolypothrix sp. LEGE 11397]UYD31110.1 hypothetical protein HGR01_40245 [Tolypothrix sp. PCC 7712]UYD38914.1 hypothetical protein HG267_41090 [Tolypothrix sp. PCC 7601]